MIPNFKVTTKRQWGTGTDTTGREQTAPRKTTSIQDYGRDLKHITKNTALQMLRSSPDFDKVSRYSLAEGNVAMSRYPKRDADMS